MDNDEERSKSAALNGQPSTSRADANNRDATDGNTSVNQANESDDTNENYGNLSASFRRQLTKKFNLQIVRTAECEELTENLEDELSDRELSNLQIRMGSLRAKFEADLRVYESNTHKWWETIAKLNDAIARDAEEAKMERFLSDDEDCIRSPNSYKSWNDEQQHILIRHMEMIDEILTRRLRSVGRGESTKVQTQYSIEDVRANGSESNFVIGEEAEERNRFANEIMVENPRRENRSPYYADERIRRNEACIALPELPPLDPGTFDEYGDWHGFWEIFEAVVDKRPTISDGVKLRYLQRSMRGRPEKEVKSFLQRGENYARIVEKLKNLYGADTKIINGLYIKLRNWQPRGDSVEAQLEMVREFETIVCQLKKLGEDAENTVLRESLLLKFSERTQRSFRKQMLEDGRIYSVSEMLDSVMKKLKIEVELRSMMPRIDRNERFGRRERVPSHTTVAKPGSESQQRRDAPERRESMAPERERNNHPYAKQKCMFCDKHTDFRICRLSKESKIEVLKREHRCFTCLGRGHSAMTCRRVCRICQRKHHEIFCMKAVDKQDEKRDSPAKKEAWTNQNRSTAKEKPSYQNRGDKTTTAANIAEDEDESDEEAEKDAERTTMMENIVCENESASIMNGCKMLIAKVTVKSDTGEQMELTAFFDSGSAISMIRKDVSRKLRLKEKSAKRLTREVFRATDSDFDENLHTGRSR